MATGAYIPTFSGPWKTALPAIVAGMPNLSGVGSPEGAVPGRPGQKYTDNNSLELYLKMRGVQEVGWELVGMAPGASAGGYQESFTGTGDPTFTPNASSASYTNQSTDEEWRWYDGDWHKIISA